MSTYPEGCGVVFGATGGIGRAIALGMAELGSNLVVVYRNNADAAEEIAAKARSLGVQSAIAQCDIRDAGAVANLFLEAQAEFGRVHSAIDSTGVVHRFSRVPEMDPDHFREVIESDIFGLFNIARAVVPMMRETGGGSLLAIGTYGLHTTLYGNSESSVSKSANQMLIRQIAKEEGRKNIRANMIGAGIIDAGMALVMREGGSGQNSYESYIKGVPLRRPGKAEELGDLAAFIMSDKGTYINGQVIHVDGGLTA